MPIIRVIVIKLKVFIFVVFIGNICKLVLVVCSEGRVEEIIVLNIFFIEARRKFELFLK